MKLRKLQPIKKYATGGPGPKRIDWSKLVGDNNSVLYDDPFATAPVMSQSPPGAGPEIQLPGNSSQAWVPVASTASPGTASNRMNWTNVGNVLQDVAPFASNIVNAFRRPPVPASPTMDAPPVFQRVNFDNDRYQVNRQISAANVAADRSLPANTAAAVRQYNMAQQLNELSKVNQQERNTNIGISNQQAMANAQTAASNNAKVDDYNMTLAEREVARQREASANWANAADKFVGIQNEKRKARTEVEKARVLASVYDKSGVLNRQRKIWKEQGIEDPLGIEYKDIKRFGGKMRKIC